MILRRKHLAAVQKKGGSEIPLIWTQLLQLYVAARQLLVSAIVKCFVESARSGRHFHAL